jgi:hypothetical protein
MGKYKVEVTVKAEVTYTVEVEASSERKAEDLAAGMWREKTPDDFQVAKGYITDWQTEAEQQTHDCEECGKEYAVTTAAALSTEAWKEDQDYCAECGAKIQAEERKAS